MVNFFVFLEDNRWWLCSPDISIADVCFSVLLHRLWQLGFERRMWENRPFIKRYYARIQQVESFKLATTIKGGNGFVDMISSPLFWGVVGVIAIAGGAYWYHNVYKAAPAQKTISVLTKGGSKPSVPVKGFSGPNDIQLQIKKNGVGLTRKV